MCCYFLMFLLLILLLFNTICRYIVVVPNKVITYMLRINTQHHPPLKLSKVCSEGVEEKDYYCHYLQAADNRYCTATKGTGEMLPPRQRRNSRSDEWKLNRPRAHLWEICRSIQIHGSTVRTTVSSDATIGCASFAMHAGLQLQEASTTKI